MALPQTVDPSTLNLSGKPAIATAPTTTTSAGGVGMPNPTIGMEKNTVSPLLGSLFGGLLGAIIDCSVILWGTGQITSMLPLEVSVGTKQIHNGLQQNQSYMDS